MKHTKGLPPSGQAAPLLRPKPMPTPPPSSTLVVTVSTFYPLCLYIGICCGLFTAWDIDRARSELVQQQKPRCSLFLAQAVLTSIHKHPPTSSTSTVTTKHSTIMVLFWKATEAVMGPEDSRILLFSFFFCLCNDSYIHKFLLLYNLFTTLRGLLPG